MDYKHDKAIIRLPDGGIVEGTVTAAESFMNGMIRVRVGDKTYLTHSTNVVLIKE